MSTLLDAVIGPDFFLAPYLSLQWSRQQWMTMLFFGIAGGMVCLLIRRMHLRTQ